jgi:carboxylate-amine ligase
MLFREPPFTIGIEEEYLLVDRQSRDLVAATPESIVGECKALLHGQVNPEFLKSQIEVQTRVCKTPGEARDELARLRATVSEVALRHGMAPIAAATHPFATWSQQVHTDKERYNVLAREMQRVARRLLICGMHVHVGIDDDDLRIDLLNQLGYFLPHLLALSTSSPFWQGEDSGLKCYRLSVFDELPRTGLPESFESYGEYQRLVATLVGAGMLDDASKIWWDARPSARFPTLELRIPDVCTRLDDAIAIAALYLCILRMLFRLRRSNQRWRSYPRLLIDENRWRAQRYGLDQGLIDFGKGELVSYIDLLDELLDLVRVDAEALGCLDEVLHTRSIAERGTSAHRQLAVYREAIEGGADRAEALRAVVDQLIEETMEGVEASPGMGARASA